MTCGSSRLDEKFVPRFSPLLGRERLFSSSLRTQKKGHAMSFTPEDYAYLCNVLLAYGLQQQSLLAVVEEDPQILTDVDFDIVYNNTLLDIASGPPSPRPTGIPSPLMPELFFPHLAALPSPAYIPSGELELEYGCYTPLYGILPSTGFSPPPIPGEEAIQSVVAPTPDDIQIHHSSMTNPSLQLSSVSKSQAQPPPHEVARQDHEPTPPSTTTTTTTTTIIQINTASPTSHHIPPPPSHNSEHTPKDYCRWLSCGQLIHIDRRSVSSHLRTAHGLDLRKKAAPILCLWPGCQSGALNADSLARHVSSTLGHLSGPVHGCEHCLQRGYLRRDGLERHLKSCCCPKLDSGLSEGNFLTVGCCSCRIEVEVEGKGKACYRQGVVQRARD